MLETFHIRLYWNIVITFFNSGIKGCECPRGGYCPSIIMLHSLCLNVQVKLKTLHLKICILSPIISYRQNSKIENGFDLAYDLVNFTQTNQVTFLYFN